LAGESTREPRAFSGAGAEQQGDDLPATGRLVVLPGDGAGATVLAAANAPAAAGWRWQKANGKWQVFLRLPADSLREGLSVDVHVWAVPRAEPDFLRQLVPTR
jgi:hypothetical protein